MNTVLTLQDLTTMVLSFFGLIVLILVIVCLIYVIGSLRRVDKIFKQNEKEINEMAKLLPQTLKKVDTTVSDVNEILEAAKPAVINISGAIDATATTVNSINTNVLSKVVDLKWVFAILTNIYSFVSDKFGKGKGKDKEKEKENDGHEPKQDAEQQAND
ncbi:MAG: hypothetical protein WCL54_00865 [Clostridia bacterium]